MGLMVDAQVLTIKETAEIVRCSRRTVLRWIGSGRLPAARLPGGEYRVHRLDVERLLRCDEIRTPPHLRART